MVIGGEHSHKKRRILIVAENMSLRLSGETVLPYQYFRHFLDDGHDVHLICHVRVREDLRRDLPDAMFDRIRFVEDCALQRLIDRIGRLLPYRVQDLVGNQLITLVTQIRMRALARALIAEGQIEVVFQPAPIAATAISAMYRLGRPVVIGPMNGGMELPPAFRTMDRSSARWLISAARRAAALLHRLIPGKLEADALIVSNPRTQRALPPGTQGRIYRLSESAVDFRQLPLRAEKADRSKPISFIFCGRFVDWKGIAFLVRAFAPIARETGARLDLVGDGALFEDIRQQIEREGLQTHIILHGRLPLEGYAALLRQADVYVTPSLRECGGIAMMEAMAVGLPVIGVRWGGAEQYTSPACAVLVDPISEQGLVDGLSDAMRTLAVSSVMRWQMGLAARRHLETHGLDWDTKARCIIEILEDVIARSLQRAPAGDPGSGHHFPSKATRRGYAR